MSIWSAGEGKFRTQFGPRIATPVSERLFSFGVRMPSASGLKMLTESSTSTSDH